MDLWRRSQKQHYRFESSSVHSSCEQRKKLNRAEASKIHLKDTKTVPQEAPCRTVCDFSLATGGKSKSEREGRLLVYLLVGGDHGPNTASENMLLFHRRTKRLFEALLLCGKQQGIFVWSVVQRKVLPGVHTTTVNRLPDICCAHIYQPA